MEARPYDGLVRLEGVEVMSENIRQVVAPFRYDLTRVKRGTE